MQYLQTIFNPVGQGKYRVAATGALYSGLRARPQGLTQQEERDLRILCLRTRNKGVRGTLIQLTEFWGLERVPRNACVAQDFGALLRGSCSKPVCLAGNFRDGQLEGAGTVTMPNGSVTVGACIYA